MSLLAVPHLRPEIVFGDRLAGALHQQQGVDGLAGERHADAVPRQHALDREGLEPVELVPPYLPMILRAVVLKKGPFHKISELSKDTLDHAGTTIEKRRRYDVPIRSQERRLGPVGPSCRTHQHGLHQWPDRVWRAPS
ncbi:hypothetical protein SBA4_4430013 [Candidatus Sulfopaludibacter sp. SbA4]|nr:hypothetical protein SBA4_4430013 [Candidatus Sulfopaludibacter sp. SbA4]